MAKVLKGDFGRDKPADSTVSETRPDYGYQLKISVPFSDPMIWRRIVVPATLTLAALHEVIQVCMSWRNEAAHQFLVGKIFYQSGFGIEDFKKTTKYDERRYELYQLEEGMQYVFSYLYDGGDGWELEITLEKNVPAGELPPQPMLLDGERGVPPEEIGDIHQFQALLAALEEGGADPGQMRVALEGEADFFPARFDRDTIIERLRLIG